MEEPATVPDMKVSAFLVPILALAHVACENPADKTTDATVTEARPVGTSPIPEGAERYSFSGDDSSIGFVGSKVTGSHEGGFKEFSGYFTVKGGALAGDDHKVIIDMTSTWSDNEKLTGHLKAADFFDVGKFPESTFAVTSVENTGEGAYTVSGNLELHGVTKNISFPATVSEEDGHVALKAEFDINRKDFDIVYSGKTDDLIRDEVVIKFDLKARQVAPEL